MMPERIDALSPVAAQSDGDPDLSQSGVVLAPVKHKPAAPVAAPRPCLTAAARDAGATFRPGRENGPPAEQENEDDA